MLTAIIVEDEYLAREELAYLIGRHSQIRVQAQFEDGLEAFKYLQSHRVDAVFLDIQIPSIDGMMLARNLLGQQRGEGGRRWCLSPPIRSLPPRPLSWRCSTISSSPITRRASFRCCSSWSSRRGARRPEASRSMRRRRRSI